MLGDGKVGSLSSSAPHLPLRAFVFLSVKRGTETRGGGHLDSLSSGFPGTWGLVIFRVANGGWPPEAGDVFPATHLATPQLAWSFSYSTQSSLAC